MAELKSPVVNEENQVESPSDTKTKETKKSPFKEQIENTKMHKHFIDFWDDLELIKEMTTVEWGNQSTVRHIIVGVLREGLLDTYPGTNKERVRHALSAKEILDRLNRMIELKKEAGKIDESIKPVSKSNLFFHLKKLDENGYVQPIGSVSKEWRGTTLNTTYYGRTAKIFIHFTEDSGPYYKTISEKHEPQKFNDFLELINRISPKASKISIDTAMKQVNNMNEESSKYFVMWAKEHQDDFRGLEIDFPELLQIFSVIYRYNHETVDGLQTIAKLLKIDMEKLADKECCKDEEKDE
jgi:DNA-binding transcriptional ArsR family regulator